MVLYGGTNYLYTIDVKASSKDRTWSKHSITYSTDIPEVKDFRAQAVTKRYTTDLYVFSGINSSKKAEKSLTIISYQSNVNIKAINHPIDNIEPRYDYACARIENTVYYYGGRNSQDVIFDDFFSFNGYEFTIINSKGMSPNALHSAILFPDINNEYLFLFGGHSEDGVEECLYRYDIKNRMWNLVKVTGDSFPSLGLGESYEVPRANATCIPIYSSVFIVGGYTDNINLCREYCDNPTLLNMNLDQTNDELENYYSILYQQTLEKKNHCDFIFYVRKKDDEWEPIHAHKCIIASRCPMMKNLTQKEEAYFEKVSKTVLSSYLRFLYTGSLIIQGEKDIEKLIEFCYESTLNFEIILKILTHDNIYLSSYDYIMDLVKKDYYSMIENKIHSDLILEIYNPETLELLQKFHVHKCILYKLSYIQSIMEMGMRETNEGVIEFTEVSVDAMKIILTYLYKGEVSISAQNAIEIYITSVIMQIDELTRFSRKTILRNVDNENALEILSFAEIYNDQTMLKYMAYYLLNNNESFEDEFKNFPIMVKQIVMEGLTRRQKTKERKIKKMITRQILGERLMIKSNLKKINPQQLIQIKKQIKEKTKQELKKQ